MWLFFQNKARLSGLLNAKSGLFGRAPVDLCRRSGTGVGKYNISTRTIWKLSSMGWVSSKGLSTVCGSMHCRAEAWHLDSFCPAVLCCEWLTSRVWVDSPMHHYRRTHAKIKILGGTWTQPSPRCITKEFFSSLCDFSVLFMSLCDCFFSPQ